MESLIKIILTCASISFGAILGVLRSKIFASKENNKLHYLFYIFSAIVALVSVCVLIIYWKELNKFDVSIVLAGIVSSVLLWLATNKFLFFKIYLKPVN